MAVKGLSAQSLRHIENWRNSGLSQAAYCRQHEIHPNTFSSWLGFYKNQDAVPAALIPVQVEQSQLVRQSTDLLILRHADGHCLELPVTQSPQWVAELLRCLG